MSSNLDKSLGDIITASGRGGSKGGRGRGAGGGRRGGRGGGGGGRSEGGAGGGRRSADGIPSDAFNPLARGEDDGGADGYGARRNQRSNNRSAPYARPASSYNNQRYDEPEHQGAWQHDMFAGGAKVIARGAKTIHISNLASDVTEEEVQEIFADSGYKRYITSAVVNYSRDGKSLGTAEVTFSEAGVASQAVEEYDAAEVDGRPMYIKLVGGLATGKTVVKKSDSQPVTPDHHYSGSGLRGRGEQQSGFGLAHGGGGARGGQRRERGGRGGNDRERGDRSERRQSGGDRGDRKNGGGGGGRRGGRGGAGGRGGGAGGKKRSEKAPSAADLDAEMDSYHSKSSKAAPAAAEEATA